MNLAGTIQITAEPIKSFKLHCDMTRSVFLKVAPVTRQERFEVGRLVVIHCVCVHACIPPSI